MAIKVKHEGNVTSRIYAAAAGGKGKRQAEDAKVLLAAQQRGNGGGGGTGGGARAGGSAPTLSAPTSHAALGSTGQMLSPPPLSFNQRSQLQAQENDAAMKRMESEQKWRSGESEKDRKFREDLQTSEWKWRSEEAEKDRKFRGGLQTDEQNWRSGEAEKERDYKDGVVNRAMRRDERSKMGFSSEQIFELEKIDDDKVFVMKNPALTKEEKELALIDLDRKAQEMMPLYPPSATAQQDFENTIVADPNTGLRYRKTSRGDYELLETAESVDKKEKQKAQDQYRKWIDNRVKALREDAENTGKEQPELYKIAQEEYKKIWGAIPAGESGEAANPEDETRNMDVEEFDRIYTLNEKLAILLSRGLFK